MCLHVGGLRAHYTQGFGSWPCCWSAAWCCQSVGLHMSSCAATSCTVQLGRSASRDVLLLCVCTVCEDVSMLSCCSRSGGQLGLWFRLSCLSVPSAVLEVAQYPDLSQLPLHVLCRIWAAGSGFTAPQRLWLYDLSGLQEVRSSCMCVPGVRVLQGAAISGLHGGVLKN